MAEQLRALTAVGAEVTLFCYGSGEGRLSDDIDVVRVPGLLSARALRAGPSAGKPVADVALAARFLAEARRRRFDVALAHNAEAALAALLVRPLTRVPVVYVAHTLLGNELDAYFSPGIAPLARRLGGSLDATLARRADGVLALCGAAAARLRPQARGPLSVIAPGLDPAPPPAAESVERICLRCGVEPGHFALYTGNVDGYQDLHLLGAAARLLPDLPIVVATHGSRVADDDALRCVHTVPGEARALTFACAVAVLPRGREGGFPIKLLNYMEAGRAIVARSGLVDGLEHGVSAWLVPRDAGPRELASAIESLSSDPVRAAKLGRGARTLLELRHGWAQLAKHTVEFCEEVVTRAPGRPGGAASRRRLQNQGDTAPEPAAGGSMKARIAWSAVCSFVVCAAWLHSPSPEARAAQNAPPAVLDALFGQERMTVALEALETHATLGAGESQRVVEIARDDSSSHHVVAIRDRETPHRHDRHDLLVVMLEGHGAMRLGDEEKPIGQGSILWVPRGTVHAFRNSSDGPAVAYAVYVPPFDGEDRVTVE